MKESILEEARVLMVEHPSKDARSFAESVYWFITTFNGWIDIKDSQPPHGVNVLLGWWVEWPNKEMVCEVRPFSTGERVRTKIGTSSNYSQHGLATHWRPLGNI